MSEKDYGYQTDDQEVVRTVRDLKRYASQNWWGGFTTGAVVLILFLAFLAGIGLYYNI